MKKVLLSIFAVIHFLIISGFSWKVITNDEAILRFNKLMEQYASKREFCVQVTYKSYDSYDNAIPHDLSNGYIIKDEKGFHSFLMGIHTFQNQYYKLVVDSSLSSILIADPSRLILEQATAQDNMELLKLCTAVKATSDENGQAFRFEFGLGNSLSAYEIYYNTLGYPIRIALFYNYSEKTVEGKLVKPRLEVQFSHWNDPAIKIGDKFSPTKYIIKTGSTFIVQPIYMKKFKLFDQRVKTRNATHNATH